MTKFKILNVKYKIQNIKYNAGWILFTFPLLLHFAVLVPAVSCELNFKSFRHEYWHFNVYSSQTFNGNLNQKYELKQNPRWRTFRPAVLQTCSREHKQVSHDSDGGGWLLLNPRHALRHLDRNSSFERNGIFC